MLTWAEGKRVQCCQKCSSSWYTMLSPKNEYVCANWDWNKYDYRIKPEPHYRPFENAEEVLEAIKEKGQYLMLKSPKGYYHINCVYPERPDLTNSPLRIRINGKVHTAKDMMTYYEWADGTPFGKLVEE